MSQTKTAPVHSTESNGPRLPHVIGVLSGIAVLAAIVLLWPGRSADQVPSGQSALGATLAVESDENPADQPSTATAGLPARIAETVAAPPAERDMSSTTGTPMAPTDHAMAILGTWKQYSHGHRLLKVHPDGTATIDVKLDGLSVLAFGEKLHFEIEWTIAGDTLRFKTVGGTPTDGVNAVKSIYGDNRVYQILAIEENQMLLQEGEKKKTPWDRVADDTQLGPQPN